MLIVSKCIMRFALQTANIDALYRNLDLFGKWEIKELTNFYAAIEIRANYK